MRLLQLSFSGTVFIIAVTIIRAAALHKLPKKTFLILWEMALVRLLFPFSIPSMFSIYTLIDHRISKDTLAELRAGTVIPTISQAHFFTVQEIAHLPADTPSSVSVWSAVWCIGMIVFAAFFILSYLRCRMEFQTALPIRNDFTAQWLKEHPLKRQISIKQSDRISAPLTYGIFCPVLLMPKKTDWENVKQLQYIFSHEYMHIYHFDAFAKLIAALVLCIHWFNPFVWAMYLLLNRDMELACDESVVRQFGEPSRSAYSRMLIDMEAEKSGILPFCSNFSKNAVEERITAIMRTKQTTPVTFLSACLTVLVTVSIFATSATASVGGLPPDMPAASGPRTDADTLAANGKNTMSITHESVAVLHYDDGAPYIHDILTNNTNGTIIEMEYCMLAYDENGSPLELYWNFLDSSAESSYENLVRTEGRLLPHQTKDYRGGWSLYDGELMDSLPQIGTGGANQVVYSLFCLKQVVFEDGTVWNNPEYENWLKVYAGKEVDVEKLENYYPYQYALE